MFCPKCANLTADAALKFCPRCGLPLAAVREAFDRETTTQAPGKERAALRKGLRRGFRALLCGAAVGFVGYVLATTVIFLGELTPPGDVKRELLVPLRYAFLAAYFLSPALTLYGVVRILYAVIFERGRAGSPNSPTGQTEDTVILVDTPTSPAPLPPRQNPARTPASFRRGRDDNAQAHAPLSVTEHTTGLL